MKKAVFVLLALVVVSCTTYKSMGFAGGYDDYPLGGGIYKVVARGNAFASTTLVRNIAFKRAAVITKELGMDFFYIIQDAAATKETYYLSTSKSGTNLNSYSKAWHEILIQPTNNPDGISVDLYLNAVPSSVPKK